MTRRRKGARFSFTTRRGNRIIITRRGKNTGKKGGKGKERKKESFSVLRVGMGTPTMNTGGRGTVDLPGSEGRTTDVPCSKDDQHNEGDTNESETKATKDGSLMSSRVCQVATGHELAARRGLVYR